ncbi:anthranilate synthase [Corynebacterium atypicum]|uniref:anthranilate synthase n=1 Tax=Corynebacterium atypicum TaxID=191610 RepID=A0ABN4DEV7_9CORY|nr:anthranilate synthase component 1 [Corynebacterium atypicum]AIG64876.1 anthranilate synthase [Corynebacterium atypicum]
MSPIEQIIAYHPDASELFKHLGGTDADFTVFLESADVSTQSGINSIGVLKAAAVVTCTGQTVQATALSPAGEELVGLVEKAKEQQRAHAAHYAPGGKCAAGETADERARLQATSNAEALKAIHRSGHMLLGGFAFDYLATFEELPEVAQGPNTYPDYQFIIPELMLTLNHRDRTASLKVFPTSTEHARELSDALCALAKRARELDRRPPRETPEDAHLSSKGAAGERTASGALNVTVSLDDAAFCAGVTQFQRDIAAGDVYQIVPSRAFHAPCPDAFAAYQVLRVTNPSPYMFYLRGRDAAGTPFELFGASPESNLKYTHVDRRVRLYPIAGTRPRGASPEMDVRNELTLRTDAKELAEHTMLVDLARNDVARVSSPGTRTVDQLMSVERYSAVMHLVSEVSGQLASGLDALDAFRACMTMGTLTGAPKLRAAELIRSFEGMRRGSFGGAIGYLKPDGDMDTCVVIRSAFVQGGRAIVQAGAGVVRDSVPQSEADETLHKAFAVLHALALSQGKTMEVTR